MKKKLFFNFFVFAVIGALVTMTSCKDYDDDISGLDNQVTAVKSDLTSLQSTVTAAQSAATAAQSSANDAHAKANEALAAAQAAGDSESIAALEEEIEELVAEIADIKEELETLAGLEARIQGLIDELETAQNAKLDAIKEDILAITEQLGTLSFAKVNSMITEVSFDFVYDDYERYRFLDYSTTTEVVDYVFSTGINNAITFVEGQRLASQAQKIIVKVSPANADLSKMLDQISLIRGDNNTEINNYLKAVKAERANPLLVDPWSGDFATITTRATPTANGLWYVWFELSQTADLEELAELTYGEGKYLDYGVEEDSEGHYLFALVIENSVDEAEDADSRFIISDFVISINTSEEFDRASELEFLVDETDVAGINNRAKDGSLSLNEEGITYEELVWDGDAQPVITGNTKVGDDRSQEPVYPAVQGVPMKIELTGEYTESIRAMYVTLDFKENAIESAPSEWNAWQSYSYSGLNTVVEGTETEIVINNASAINDIIGFRVFAVNYDGTLVDPDGKAFYVSLGVEGADWGTVNTVITPVGEAVDGTISANVAKTLTALTGAATYEWTTDVDENEIEGTPAFHVVLKDADGELFSTDGGDVTNVDFEDVTTIHTVPTALSWLAYEDDKVYNGTLVIKNETGHVIATLKVTFKKELPTTAPSGFSIKTNQLGSDGIYRSYLVPTLGDDTPSWTAPN